MINKNMAAAQSHPEKAETVHIFFPIYQGLEHVLSSLWKKTSINPSVYMI